MLQCCNDSTKHQATYASFLSNIQPCTKHNRRVDFICLQKKCQQHLLLCPLCITEHNGHSFQNIEKFLTPDKYRKLTNQKGKKHQHLEEISHLVKRKLTEIQDLVNNKIAEMQKYIDEDLQRIEQTGAKAVDTSKPVNNQTMLQIKRYLDEQWSYSKCQRMKQCFDKVLNAVYDSYENIANDLWDFIQEEDWQQIEQKEYADIEKKYFNHLHQHNTKGVDYFRFDADSKAPNIKLREKRLEAHYLRSTPSCPFAVCDEYVDPEHNKWIIYIKDCESRMVFFNASTIYVGVCKPDTAKRMNYAGLSEGGRGTYLIGSNGWSYHHTNSVFDRQDIVGFTFGKGDRILVEIEFKNRGKIKFKKLGKLYDSPFEMGLDLDEKQFKNLKPCVGFHQEVGVEVRIENVK